MNIFRYEIDNSDKFVFASIWGKEDPELVAEDAAEDYHSNHDGWEACWPLEITLFEDDGTKIGEFEVDRESVPSFVTIRKELA